MKERGRGSKLVTFLTTQTAVAALVGPMMGMTGCNFNSKNTDEVSNKNLVQAGNPSLIRSIGDQNHQFKILGEKAFASELRSGGILSAESAESLQKMERLPDTFPMDLDDDQPENTQPNPTDSNSLLFGMPVGMLNHPTLLGAVITRVSDHQSKNLGMLKMSNTPAFQVLPMLYKAPDTQKYSVVLIMCGEDCSKLPAKPVGLFQIPVLGFDEKQKLIITDLSALGATLDLQAIFGAHPALKQLKSRSSRAITFDYSNGTLVYDIETHFISKDGKDNDPSLQETVITNRWYMKPMTDFNAAFVKRKPAAGVGFFTSSRPVEHLINRWDFDRRGSNDGIKYYIKNVPQRFQASFASAFEHWNEKLFPIIGKKVFSYEFIASDDPRSALLVAGDVRYNIVEWDLDNVAGYGGLGPSIAHPYTGELTQATVLVQGPTIIDLYSKWYKASQAARRMQARRLRGSDSVLASAQIEIQAAIDDLTARKFQVRLGKHVEMAVPSQQPSLEDPIMSRDQFEPVPKDVSFAAYMDGYFKDMLSHELGHNLGLRHNFKGNLGASNGSPELGKVSRSIMEYLGRDFRYLDLIGEYDLMAISYGYAGVLPEHTDWFCTDEDLADLKDPTKSAECSRDDATADPFGHFQERFTRALDLLLARGSVEAPEWKVADLKVELQSSLTGLASYAVSAERTASTWTNFFQDSTRPQSASGIRTYALDAIRGVLCDSQILSEIQQKSTPEAQNVALSNVLELRQAAKTLLAPAFSELELACAPASFLH